MSFSLKAIFDYLDSQPQQLVMAMVAQAYETNTDRGLFSNKFIPYEQLHFLGYAGFKQMVMSIYEIDASFVEANRQELYSITRKLKEINDERQT